MAHDLLVELAIFLRVESKRVEVTFLHIFIIMVIRFSIGVLVETVLILGIAAADDGSLAVAGGDEGRAI